MIADEAQIERIVRQVLDRVGQLGSADAATVQDTSTADQLTLQTSVVTLETIEDKLEGIKQVVVAKSAVVTPAAHDEIADRGIELKRCSKVATSASSKPTDKQVITETAAAGSPTHAVAAICQKLESCRSLGVLLTDRPAAATCVANRQKHIRAAHVTDGDTARDASESMDANLIVIDARATEYQVKSMIQAVQQATANVGCADLQAALGQKR